jgi:60 kDa SS-A/Ro ribonucleoprotein
MFGSICIGNENIHAAEAAAVMSMVVMRSCKNFHICAFKDRLVDLGLKSTMSFEEVMSKLEKASNGWGGTDCSLPILEATSKNMNVDTFITLTDNESWRGRIHPFEALKKYRQKNKKNTKMAYLSFSANGTSLAEESDKGCIDIAGLDSHVPQILHDFIEGKI